MNFLKRDKADPLAGLANYTDEQIAECAGIAIALFEAVRLENAHINSVAPGLLELLMTYGKAAFTRGIAAMTLGGGFEEFLETELTRSPQLQRIRSCLPAEIQAEMGGPDDARAS